MKSFQHLWWIAAGLVILSEGVVLWKLSPEKEAWADQALLELDIAALNSPASQPHPTADLTGGSDRSSAFVFHERPEGLTGAVEQLSFSQGLCGIFIPEDGVRQNDPALELFYFEYGPGNPRFIHDVFGHAPEVCMKASGAILKESHGTREIEVEGKPISVRVLEFSSPASDRPLWIFKLTWLPENAPIQPSDSASSLRREKILTGVFRNPRPPARVILGGGRNFESLEKAWVAFEELVAARLYFSVTESEN